jgi:hypothetical protein
MITSMLSFKQANRVHPSQVQVTKESLQKMITSMLTFKQANIVRPSQEQGKSLQKMITSMLTFKQANTVHPSQAQITIGIAKEDDHLHDHLQAG